MGWSGGTFTRTNGVNTGATAWATDAAAGVKIRADRHDTHDQDLATGINQCINKDGSNTASQLNVDNIRVDGNTISSQDTNGNIELSPNGTGLVNIAAVGDLAIAGTAITPDATEINLACDGSVSGSYTATLTGVSGTETTTIKYVRVGNIVILSHSAGNKLATSNATTFTLTGMPEAIRPVTAVSGVFVWARDSGTDTEALMTINTNGTIALSKGKGIAASASGWTNTGSKGFSDFSICYSAL